jgi:hypothetical protein
VALATQIPSAPERETVGVSSSGPKLPGGNSGTGELGDGREVHLKLAFRRIAKHELNLKSTSSNIFLLEFELWDAWPE